MKKSLFIVVFVLFCMVSCKEKAAEINLVSPKKEAFANDALTLTEAERYDKVLGALVGSAIGDAMGASTEMWHRKDIQLKYGYITTLTPALREQSPEGTWEHNLAAGSTTDDTRWKYLITNYLTTQKTTLGADALAQFITGYYTQLTDSLKGGDIQLDTDLLDDHIEKIDWIKEWARVALAYKTGPEAYQKAQHRFYGGELSCAGQLYTPMFGLIATNAEEAYGMAYEHAIFDLGYAKDISALVAAMTHMALRTQNMDSILGAPFFIDPIGYQDSRLVGRIATNTADRAIKNVLAVQQSPPVDPFGAEIAANLTMPEKYTGSPAEWIQQESMYQTLEKEQQAIPFHSGEIWQILVTGLQFGEGDFLKTMQFIVNYGRDNDTVAAVAGMILGAKVGYAQLPTDLKAQILKTNKDQLGIDLEAMAKLLSRNYKLTSHEKKAIH